MSVKTNWKNRALQHAGCNNGGYCDFTALVEELQNKGNEEAISLDANEDNDEKSAFYNFVTGNNLVDTYRHMHPSSKLATYLCGNKQLDYLLISPGLLPALISIG
eukprot:701714-Ditylum_brightwellii.AAC.1